MKQQNATWMLQAPAMAAIAILLIQPLRAEVIEKTKEMGGTAVYLKLSFPMATIQQRRIRPFWPLAAVRRR